jgi:predicted amidohydrolase YtcJ
MESDEPTYAEAIVEKDGTIAFVGSKKEAEEKFEDAKRIDLKGKTLLPGFIDPHSHFGMVSNTMGQVDLNSAPVGTVTNIRDIVKKIKKYKEENKYSGWRVDLRLGI